MRPNRLTNLPAIHATKDGFVGFMVVTGQQWLDFCAMVAPAWADDLGLRQAELRLGGVVAGEREHHLAQLLLEVG